MEEFLEGTKFFISHFQTTNTEELVHHKTEVNKKLIELSKYLSELSILNQELTQLEQNTKTTKSVPKVETILTELTQELKPPEKTTPKIDKPLEKLVKEEPFFVGPIESNKSKGNPPISTQIDKPKQNSNGLESFFEPLKLDEFISKTENPLPVTQNIKSFSSFDKVLNIKEDMITFDHKSEKTTKILHLFENPEPIKKPEEEKKKELKLDDLF